MYQSSAPPLHTQVESAIWSLSSHTAEAISHHSSSPSPSSFSPLLPCNKTLGAACNKLAASVQTVLRSCTSETMQYMMAEVQSLAQNTGRAVKSLSTLLKGELEPFTNHKHEQPPPTVQSGVVPSSHLTSAPLEAELHTTKHSFADRQSRPPPAMSESDRACEPTRTRLAESAKVPGSKALQNGSQTSPQDPYLEVDDDYV